MAFEVIRVQRDQNANRMSALVKSRDRRSFLETSASSR